ncbi:hypothetical protein CUR47_01390 [Lactiplantibacillus plantarum]|nr:hypothetical protein CUR47_01390 [Lactiplantibacillus plantarum]
MTPVANHMPARRSNRNGGPIIAVHPEFTDLLIMTDPTIFPQTVARFYAHLILGRNWNIRSILVLMLG